MDALKPVTAHAPLTFIQTKEAKREKNCEKKERSLRSIQSK